MEEPLIAITNIVINKDNFNLLGEKKNTLRINLPNKKTSMIKFNLTEEEKEELNPENGTLILTAIGKCSLNYYMGNTTPQIMLEDFDIERKQKWNF